MTGRPEHKMVVSSRMSEGGGVILELLFASKHVLNNHWVLFRSFAQVNISGTLTEIIHDDSLVAFP